MSLAPHEQQNHLIADEELKLALEQEAGCSLALWLRVLHDPNGRFPVIEMKQRKNWWDQLHLLGYFFAGVGVGRMNWRVFPALKSVIYGPYPLPRESSEGLILLALGFAMLWVFKHLAWRAIGRESQGAEEAERKRPAGTGGGNIQMIKFDWNQMRQDSVARVRAATTLAEREAGLTLYQQSMDAVERASERQGWPRNDIEEFKEAIRQEYCLLLIEECTLVQPVENTEKGLLDPATLGAITTREVLAGRMHPDDGVHRLAIAGARILTADAKALISESRLDAEP